ncbi:MAG: outer membrane beta-barrel domain-containing protein [Myxococcaceae bacterium]|nr:outer membrane beta-barrel domain-containing protein [Myxococcaceae bacterium]
MSRLCALPSFVALALVVSAPAFAQTQELENPGVTAAVQDRPYRLLHELDLWFGVLPLDAFYTGIYAQVGYVYHFTDRFAWQVGRGAYGLAARSSLRGELERNFGVQPTANDEVQFFVGSDVMWKPFYGKLAVMNRAVIHGEIHLLAGATLFRFTNSGFRPGINIGGGGRIFVNKYVSFRLDITHNVVLPTGGGTTSFGNVLTVNLALALNFGGND